MIGYLRGEILEIDPTKLIILCGGVGYDVSISLSTYSSIKDLKQVGLYTYLHVREDALLLYGFFELEEKVTFQRLIGVSGIGPNTAKNMLSHISPKDLRNAILHNELNTIQAIKGIGAKTAQRLVLELRDKMIDSGEVSESGEIVNKGNNLREEALLALTSLGLSRKQAGLKIEKAIRMDSELTVEELIKAVLKS